MFPKEHSEREDMDYYDYLQCQQVVPERRKGKKCKLCYRREKGLQVSSFMRHGDFCFAPLSDDGSSADERSDLPEPDAADDDPDLERNRLYSVTDRYQSYTK